jgi:Flp pilus assembly pilin Flp
MTTSTPHARPGACPAPLRRPAGGGLARRRPVLDDDRGSATAEYAVVILAAVAFAGVLVAVMRSGEVQAILTDLVRGALSL